MVPPTLFVSGAIAVLHLCNEVYTRYRGVRRFRKDCELLAGFVHRIEHFITETEDDTDMTGPGWEAAFSALHDSLLQVVTVFEQCAKYGMIRSLMNADELSLRLNSISQRLMLALQLIPIQKAKVTNKRLAELQAIQVDIRSATFTAVRAAEEQSANLKRLMDQSRLDAGKTQEMLAQVLAMLQADPTRCAAAAAGYGTQQQQQQQGCSVDRPQLEAELADLHAELECAVRDKNVTEEQYLEQIIAAIGAMEKQMGQEAAAAAAAQPPVNLRCPITQQLLVDPVILVESAQTYERAAIQEWLDRGNKKDPMSGVEVSSTVVVPNIALRKMAQDWLEANPSYTEQQQQQQQEPSAVAAAAADTESDKDEALAKRISNSISISITPKTAAILAASEESGLQPLSSSGGVQTLDLILPAPVGDAWQQQQQQQLLQQQQSAMQERSDSGETASFPIGRVPSFADSYLPQAATQQQQQALLQPVAELLPPAATRTSNDTGYLSLGSSSMNRQQGQQQQPMFTAFEGATSFLPVGSSSMSRQERAVAAAAAAAAAVAAQQQGGRGTLRQLQGTLGRAAETRCSMTMRHRGPQAVKEAQEQLRQERQQQRQQQQEEEDRMFLQQHMERLMHQQSLEQSLPRGAGFTQSQLAASASVPNIGIGVGLNSSAAYQINSSKSVDAGRAALLAGASSGNVAPAPSAVRHYHSFELPPNLTGLQVQPSVSAARSDCGPGSREQPREQRGSMWRFGSRSRQRAEADAQFDDTASVSSSTSSASRRSVGQNFMSAVKSVKYAMVYDDRKV